MRLFILLLLFLFIACSGTRPENLGLKDRKLIPCPLTPNCVSSFAEISDSHYFAPIPFTASVAEEKSRIKKIYTNAARVKLVREENDYLNYEFTTLIMRYVDDVEFFLDDKSKLIYVRSASRLGSSDWGVNRKRMEDFQNKLKTSN